MADGVRKPRHTQRASGRRAADIVRQREAWASRARRSDGRNRQSRDESVHEEEPPLRHVRHLPRTESVFEKQGEPHHQFECAVHDRVQKPARLVSARKLGPTDVPRSRRVRPGGVRRCDSLALRLSSDRPQTEHARRHASTHVRTAGRCTPVGLRTEVGVNLTINGSCVPIIRRIMSGRMKKQAVCLQMLIKTKNAKLRKAILEHADSELIRALCECAHNILRGNVKMTPREKTRLRKYHTKLRLIARKNVSVKQKRRHLQQTGGFLPALLAPLAASVVIPLLRQLFA